VDYRLEQWINGFAGQNAALDSFMVHVAQWSEILFLGLVVVWYLYGWLGGHIEDRRGAITATLAAAMSLLVNQIIILFWSRPRPFMTHSGTVRVLMHHSKDPSFPSDHAGAAMAIAVALLMVHKRAGILAVIAALLVGLARVFAVNTRRHHSGTDRAPAHSAFDSSVLHRQTAAAGTDHREAAAAVSGNAE